MRFCNATAEQRHRLASAQAQRRGGCASGGGYCHAAWDDKGQVAAAACLSFLNLWAPLMRGWRHAFLLPSAMPPPSAPAVITPARGHRGGFSRHAARPGSEAQGMRGELFLLPACRQVSPSPRQPSATGIKQAFRQPRRCAALGPDTAHH